MAIVQRSSRDRSLILAITCVVLSGVTLLLPQVPFRAEMAMTLGMVVVTIAWTVRRKLRGEFDWFELFLIFSILNIFYFGVGALWLLANPEQLLSLSLLSYISSALAVGLVGYLCAAAGYALLGGRTPPAPIGKFVPSGSGFLVFVSIIGFAGEVGAIVQERLVAVLRTGFSPVASAVQQFSPVFLFAWALAWLQFWTGGLGRVLRTYLIVVVVPMAVVVIVGLFGSKELTLVILGIPAIAFWYARRKLPWRALAAFVLIGIFVIFPLYNTYRNQANSMRAHERLERAVDTAAQWNQKQYLQESVTAFMKRMSLVYCVGAILRDVPSAVPYRYGETLALAPIALFIPRFVWPEKPNIVIGREFAVTFQLVNAVDETTQVSPTMTGELYWNLGLPGVVVGMFLLGGAMRVFYERFGGGLELEPLRRACYLALLPTAIHFEGNVATMLVGLVKSLVIFGLIFLLARRVGWLTREVEPVVPSPPAP